MEYTMPSCGTNHSDSLRPTWYWALASCYGRTRFSELGFLPLQTSTRPLRRIAMECIGVCFNIRSFFSRSLRNSATWAHRLGPGAISSSMRRTTHMFQRRQQVIFSLQPWLHSLSDDLLPVT